MKISETILDALEELMKAGRLVFTDASEIVKASSEVYVGCAESCEKGINYLYVNKDAPQFQFYVHDGVWLGKTPYLFGFWLCNDPESEWGVHYVYPPFEEEDSSV